MEKVKHFAICDTRAMEMCVRTMHNHPSHIAMKCEFIIIWNEAAMDHLCMPYATSSVADWTNVNDKNESECADCVNAYDGVPSGGWAESWRCRLFMKIGSSR